MFTWGVNRTLFLLETEKGVKHVKHFQLYSGETFKTHVTVSSGKSQDLYWVPSQGILSGHGGKSLLGNNIGLFGVSNFFCESQFKS